MCSFSHWVGPGGGTCAVYLEESTQPAADGSCSRSCQSPPDIPLLLPCGRSSGTGSTGWYRLEEEASGSSVVTTLQAALLAGYRGPSCSPKIHQEIQTGGHIWLCLCSPGDPFFFPNTLLPQKGNRLPIDAEHFLPTFFFQKLQSELQNLKNTLNIFFSCILKIILLTLISKGCPLRQT